LDVRTTRETKKVWNKIKMSNTHEAKELSPNQDLKINGALVSMLKRAGFQVKSFKATKKGYNEIWSGEFKTKNAILPMSVSKYGDVFYQDKNIGRIDKSNKIIDWMKSIKRNNKWVESKYKDLHLLRPINERMDVGDVYVGTARLSKYRKVSIYRSNEADKYSMGKKYGIKKHDYYIVVDGIGARYVVDSNTHKLKLAAKWAVDYIKRKFPDRDIEKVRFT